MTDSFSEFVSTVGTRVTRALVAAYGVEVGTEAAAEAMAVAWERWTEVSTRDNPAGYLFRIGQSRARPHVRWARRHRRFPSSAELPDQVAGEPDAALVDVFRALSQLRQEHRVAIILVRSYGFTYQEAAAVMNTTETAVTNHLHRGMAILRQRLGVQR